MNAKKFKNLSFDSLKKLYKRVTIFDFLLLLCVVIVIGFFLYLRFSQTDEWIYLKLQVTNDRYTLDESEVNYRYITSFEKGAVSINSLGSKTAEIVDVISYESWNSGKITEVKLKVLANYNPRRNVYTYNFKPIYIGATMNFPIDNAELKGIVLEIQSEDEYLSINQLKTKVEVEVLVEKLPVDVANAYKPGLKVLDSQGQDVAEIVSVELLDSPGYYFSDIRGGFIRASDPNMKNVKLVVALNAREYKGSFYTYDNLALKIGNTIHLHFKSLITVGAIVTSVSVND